ncbi:MAG: hypothetical protein EOP48_13685 [Sphingobacteriales bacterium]|nr:MAG: hypothetical protein EOP48_13685 [Sphingobacteriales bacterium]
MNGKLSTDYQAMSVEASTAGTNLVFNGVSSPAVFGSLNNSVSYDRLTLAFSMSYKLGYYFTRPTISYASLVNQGAGHSDYALRWQQQGDEQKTNVPAFIYPVNTLRDGFYSLSEANVFKADNVRLDYINASYRFNSGAWKFPMRTLDISLGMQNAGILWKAIKEKIDPDNPRGIRLSKIYVLSLKGNF